MTTRLMCACEKKERERLGAEEDIFSHDCMQSTCMYIFREAKSCLEVLGNFMNKPLEGKLPDQEFRRLLVTTNFSKSYGTRLVTVRLLYSTSRGRKSHEIP